jgi:hypothetical protein
VPAFKPALRAAERKIGSAARQKVVGVLRLEFAILIVLAPLSNVCASQQMCDHQLGKREHSNRSQISGEQESCRDVTFFSREPLGVEILFGSLTCRRERGK